MSKLTRQQTLMDYDGFVEKFKPKKTTDDCYTPQPIYDAIASWVRANIPGLADADPWLRPFYPGGDYLKEDYPEGCAVVDNPPFSILAQIVRNYQRNGVKFFLFAPHLTAFNYLRIDGVTVILTDARITYANGAKVNTAFITNCWPTDAAVVISGELREVIEKAGKGARSEKKLKVVKWPDNVTSSALLVKIITSGITMEFPADEVCFIRGLDNGKKIFGDGVLISDRLAAELRAAELRATELRATEKVVLSQREKNIIELLNKAKQ